MYDWLILVSPQTDCESPPAKKPKLPLRDSVDDSQWTYLDHEDKVSLACMRYICIQQDYTPLRLVTFLVVCMAMSMSGLVCETVIPLVYIYPFEHMQDLLISLAKRMERIEQEIRNIFAYIKANPAVSSTNVVRNFLSLWVYFYDPEPIYWSFPTWCVCLSACMNVCLVWCYISGNEMDVRERGSRVQHGISIMLVWVLY